MALKNLFNQKLESSVLILIFLFPILMATLSNSVSGIFVLLLILSIVAYFQKPTPKLTSPEKTVLVGFVLVFMVYFLGMLNSEEFYSGYKKLGKFSYFLLATPIFLLLKRYRKTILPAFHLGIIVSGFVLLSYLLLANNYVSGDYYDSTNTGAYHSIIYGDFSMLIVGIGILLSLLTDTTKIHKILFLLSALCASGASLIVGAKGSWVALPILLVILVWLVITQKHLRMKIAATFIGFILAIAAAVIVFPGQTITKFNEVLSDTFQFLKNEQNTRKQKSSSSGARMVFWKASVDTFEKQPFFGSGSGDFNLELRRFLKENPKYNEIADDYHSAHSIFFEWLALFGIIGFLALIVTVFFLPLKFFWQTTRNNPDKLWVGLIGIWVVLSSMVFGLTETWIIRSAPNGVYMFFILLLMTFVANSQSQKNITR